MGFHVQCLLKARKERLSRSPLTDFSKGMSPYVLFGNSTCEFKVIATCSEDLSPLSQQKPLVGAGMVWKSEKGLDTAAFYFIAGTDDAPRYVAYFTFDRLNLLISNCSFYSEGVDWSDLFQYVPKAVQPPQGLQNQPDSVVTAFKLTLPAPPDRL